MFNHHPPQSYDEVLDLIQAGNAELVIHNRYDSSTPETRIPLSNSLQLDHELYTRFASMAPGHVKDFVCGMCREWDGTSKGVFYDGLVFSMLREFFINALKYHNHEDGASYLWEFLTGWESLTVLGPSVEVRHPVLVTFRDGSESLFNTEEEAEKACASKEWGSRGKIFKVVPIGHVF